MNRELAAQAAGKFFAGVFLTAALIFLPAGTLRYWNGALLLAVLFLPMLAVGLILLRKSPELLRRRLESKEQELAQRRVVAVSGLMFVGGFVLAGLDFRFGWTSVPGWVAAAAAGVLLLGYLLYGEVLRENAYLSRTVQVQEGQRVIDTGLYGVVRHPMYLATILLFLSMPVVLGSWIAFAVFCVYPAVLVSRIRNEEAVLERELEGYTEYKRRVRYRLVPFIW